MFEYKFDSDEKIVLVNEDVSWYSRSGIVIDEMVLTNKNIYCTYEKSNGLFKKATKELCVLSLTDINIVNGQAIVQQIRYEGAWCLQIQFKQGTEYFAFYDSPKKVIPQWIASINNSLGIEIETVSASTKKTGTFAGAFAGFADNFKSVINTATETLGISTKQTSNVATANVVSYSATIPITNQMEEEIISKCKYCVECGTKLEQGVKFCPNCGNKVGTANNVTVSMAEHSTEMKSTPSSDNEFKQHESTSEILKTQRQQEYIGKIYKCPHCGNVISQSDAVCDSCGNRLSGKQAVSSAMDFQQKIMEIEMSRKKSGFWDVDNETDKKILALVKTYPIPNSIEDIVEFMHLAIGNINVSTSKKSIVGWLESGVPEHQLSNAWVAKMQQIYKKAELLFPNEPEFAHIRDTYVEMMNKLKLKI